LGYRLGADLGAWKERNQIMKLKAVHHCKLVWLVSILALALGIFTPRARASQWDKLTIVTVNQPIQVRDTLLQPGKYVFKLLDSNADRHIVQIFNGDQSHIINTILAVPTERRLDQVTGHTDFTFWETPGGYAKAMRDWYYPGDSVGQEFSYPKNPAPIETASVSTSELQTQGMVQTPDIMPDMTPAPVPEPMTTQPEAPPPVAQQSEESETQPEIAQAAPPPAPAPPPEQPPAQPEQPSTLPKTASPYPLAGVTGLLSLALYGLVRRKRSA
jgi:hypothetical protein